MLKLKTNHQECTPHSQYVLALCGWAQQELTGGMCHCAAAVLQVKSRGISTTVSAQQHQSVEFADPVQQSKRLW